MSKGEYTIAELSAKIGITQRALKEYIQQGILNKSVLKKPKSVSACCAEGRTGMDFLYTKKRTTLGNDRKRVILIKKDMAA